MQTNHHRVLYIALFIVLSAFSCENTDTLIVPEEGYQWPQTERSYWPTDGWETASAEEHGINPERLAIAHKFADDDALCRSLLVIKDGFLIYEKYYGDGGIDQSTNLWSVTKSVTSALVGLLMDQGTIQSTNQYMVQLMPDYPAFGEITLQQVLTMTTGLSWAEEGPLWVDWIRSDDWVAAALDRGQKTKPGKEFYYSSGNSHFLTALIDYTTGISPGEWAKTRLFDPMGIEFETLESPINPNHWPEFLKPLPQSWRQDPQGIECAGFALNLTARDMAKFGFLFLNRGRWADQQLLSEDWVKQSTKDHHTSIYGRYSYGYQWWMTRINDIPVFLASGFGGQIIGVVPSLDMVVVLKYEAENPVHPVTGSAHDDMMLFQLVVEAAKASR